MVGALRGQERAPVVDSWGQTETGGVLMVSGSRSGLAPLPGVEASAQEGRLLLDAPWPSMASALIGAGV